MICHVVLVKPTKPIKYLTLIVDASQMMGYAVILQLSQPRGRLVIITTPGRNCSITRSDNIPHTNEEPQSSFISTNWRPFAACSDRRSVLRNSFSTYLAK